MALQVESANLKCPDCGAGFDPPEGEIVKRVLTCAYCGKKIMLRREKPVAPPTQQQVGVPLRIELPQWNVERYKGGWIKWLVAMIVLVVLGGGVASWMLVSGGRRAMRAIGGAAGGGGGPSLPIVCTGAMTIANESYKGAGLIVEAKGDCNLTINGSTLASSSGVAITVTGAARVVANNSTIEGRGAAAVTVSGTGSFRADSTTIKGGEAGVSAEGQGQGQLRNCTVSGTAAAVQASGEAKIDADDSNGLTPGR